MRRVRVVGQGLNDIFVLLHLLLLSLAGCFAIPAHVGGNPQVCLPFEATERAFVQIGGLIVQHGEIADFGGDPLIL